LPCTKKHAQFVQLDALAVTHCHTQDQSTSWVTFTVVTESSDTHHILGEPHSRAILLNGSLLQLGDFTFDVLLHG
jgi:hypothetical protein